MGEPVTTGVLIELDQRRRASLGRVGRHEQYLAREEPDGTLVLTPAVVMRVSDLEALVGPKKASQVKEGPKKTVASAVPDAVVVSRTAHSILEVVRAAGADGITAGNIVKNVEGSRSQIYNELAVLRRLDKVSNLTGKYILGSAA